MVARALELQVPGQLAVLGCDQVAERLAGPQVQHAAFADRWTVHGGR